MSDTYAHDRVELDSPVVQTEQADLSSGDHEFTNPTRMILWATEGTAVFRVAGDTEDRTLTDMPAGLSLPFRVTHIRESGTTATIIGGW